MKKKYLAVAVLLMFLGIMSPKALAVGDCKVLVSFKLSSSLDEEKYICKGNDYGTSENDIYYTSSDNTIHLNNFNSYYFRIWETNDITFNISNQNNISMLQIGNSQFKVIGNGSLKFKQNSFVKKVINGESVYQYVFNGKILLNQDKKIFEGTIDEFETNYELLKDSNEIPLKYDLTDYEFLSSIDYEKMTSVVVTENWLNKHIKTQLDMSVNDGYGVIKYVTLETKPEEPKEESTTTQLETDNVILIAEEKLEVEYELKETDIKDENISSKVSEETEKDLISLYDVTVYNGETEVSMKNGKYTIMIKLDDNYKDYEDYQIIYVNDDNEIEEYITGRIEGDYIVFETTHLSHYGVIAKPRSSNVKINIYGKNSFVSKINIRQLLKISILLFLVFGSLALIGFIIFKSKLLTKKRKRA